MSFSPAVQSQAITAAQALLAQLTAGLGVSPAEIQNEATSYVSQHLDASATPKTPSTDDLLNDSPFHVSAYYLAYKHGGRDAENIVDNRMRVMQGFPEENFGSSSGGLIPGIPNVALYAAGAGLAVLLYSRFSKKPAKRRKKRR